jgi:long-chain acyl-CoA synthetase
VVSVISDNCPEWLYTDLGTMSVGGVTNGIYTTDSPRQVEYILNDSGTRFFFAENEEQLDKILEVRARCPQLVKIFVYDMEGLHDFRDEQVMPFEALLSSAPATSASIPAPSTPWWRSPGPHDLAILVYTSGTTGPPKGAMLSHQNIIFQLGYSDFIAEPRPGDQQLSFLPLSHVAERTFTVFYPLRTGATVNFAESIDTVPENIREVRRRCSSPSPHLGEVLLGRGLRMREATPVGKLAYRWAIGVGDRMAEQRIAAGGRRRRSACSIGWPTSSSRQRQALARATPHARRGHRGGAHRPRADQVVHGARASTCARSMARRELRPRHRHAARVGSSSARWGEGGRTPRWRSRPPARSC